MYVSIYLPYSGKVWWGESLANLANRRRFVKLKPSKLIPTIDNPLADLFIRQTFFRQTFKNSRFAKHSARQTFPLYSMLLFNTVHVLLIMIKVVIINMYCSINVRHVQNMMLTSWNNGIYCPPACPILLDQDRKQEINLEWPYINSNMLF